MHSCLAGLLHCGVDWDCQSPECNSTSRLCGQLQRAIACKAHLHGPCLQDSDIAWHYDRDHLYGHYLATNYNNIPAFRGGNTTTTYIDKSQHFMVWMRPSVHATVRKLYGVIDEDIPAGGAQSSSAVCAAMAHCQKVTPIH